MVPEPKDKVEEAAPGDAAATAGGSQAAAETPPRAPGAGERPGEQQRGGEPLLSRSGVIGECEKRAKPEAIRIVDN